MSPARFRTGLVTAPDDLAAVYRIRHDVFVLEQDVPLDLERDEHDETADHFLVVDTADVTEAADVTAAGDGSPGSSGTPVGAGRLLVEPGAVGHLGRLAVLPPYRGSGAGAALVRAIEDRARERGLRRIVLDAQLTALRFYERLGYAAHGPEFLDAGILHRRMHRDL